MRNRPPSRAASKPRRPNIRRARAALPLALLVPLAAPVHAAKLGWEAGFGLEHGDNVARTETDERSDTILVPRIAFELEQEGASVRAEAAGSLEYRHYLDDSFDDETRADLAAVVDWTLLPERLRWSFGEYAGVQPIDTLNPAVPSNQQQTSVFRTGPVLRFRLDPGTFLQTEARYTHSYAQEKREFNGDRVAGIFRWVREIDPTRNLSFNASAEAVRFDRDESSDYDRADVYGAYSTRSARFVTEVLFGYTEIGLDGRDDESGPLLELRLRTDPEQVSRWRATLTRRFSDAAQDLVVDPAELGDLPRGPGSAVITVNGFVFEETALYLGYERRGERSTFRVDPFYREQDYPTEPAQDLTERGVQLAHDWRVGVRTTIGATLGYARREYDGIERTDTQKGLALRLEQQRSRHWRIGVSVQHERRDSDAELQDYDDNRVLAYAAWRR